ncbi:apolipoprotein N-acyltransferase [Algicola sagamiensis]|uniref:apolipoprotein N-acyltransferase n=1 Tax=Algicola sagamiensis TaxID=163869 RepID=UPI000374EF00|nr:apolipoprotein N-acyltransferase [Algicola sagamiensis]
MNQFFLRHRTALGLSLTAYILGFLNTFSYAPYHFWMIPFATLSGFLLLLAYAKANSETTKHVKKISFIFGVGWFSGGVSWVHVSIATFGGLPLIGSLSLIGLLVAYLSLFPLVFGWLLTKFPTRYWPLMTAPIWWGVEWIRSWLFTGFPWLSLGYSQTDGPLYPLASLIGETGLMFMLMFFASCMVVAMMQKQWRPLVACVVFFSGLFLLQGNGIYKKGESRVLLVQGNIPQEMRWIPEKEWSTMLKYMDMTRPHFSETDLIIWPEAAIPALEPSAQDFLENLDKAAANNNTALISGIISYFWRTKEIYNALVVVGKKEQKDESGQYYFNHPNRYYKHHLLPIGEFVPFETFLRKLAPIFDLPMSSFTRGDFVQPNLVANGLNLVPAICFEVAFTNQIAASLKEETDFILTVSNDAWFGDSIGPNQHLDIARMRAVEYGRPMLRATNNGVTAVIDAQGQIVKQIPQFEDAVLKTTVDRVRGQTVYWKYGNTPLMILALLMGTSGLLSFLREKRLARSQVLPL